MLKSFNIAQIGKKLEIQKNQGKQTTKKQNKEKRKQR